jgi:hypothetical protein
MVAALIPALRVPAFLAVLALACEVGRADDPITLPSVLIIDDIEYRAQAEPHPRMLSVRIDVTNRGETETTIQLDVCPTLVAFGRPPTQAADVVWEEDAVPCAVEFTELHLRAGETASVNRQGAFRPFPAADEYYLGIRFRPAAAEPVLLSGGSTPVKAPIER